MSPQSRIWTLKAISFYPFILIRIGLVVNSIVMPKDQFDQSYKSYMLAQQNVSSPLCTSQAPWFNPNENKPMIWYVYNDLLPWQQRRMVKKALVLWGPKHDPSPQAAEWMKRSKDKIEPILARWDTLTPDQLMQEVCDLKKSCDPKTSYASVVQKLIT